MEPVTDSDMPAMAGVGLAASLPLEAQNNDSDPLQLMSQAELEEQAQSLPQIPTEIVALNDADDMKQPPIIKAAPVKRRSKQLTRMFIATKRLLPSTIATEKDGEPEEMFPLPTSSSFLLRFNNTNNSHSPGLTESLPDDNIYQVTSFLDVQSLLQVRLCNRTLKKLASRNEAGWERLCRMLWKDKIHVLASMQQPWSRSPSTVEVAAVTTTDTKVNNEVAPDFYMNAYRQSIQDATQRQHVTMDELCYDPDNHTGTVWSFRFKESAGADWTATDPWFLGQKCRKMVFLKDGTVRQYVSAAAEDNADDDNDNAEDAPANVSSSSNGTESVDSESLPELISPNFGNLLLNAQQPDIHNIPPQQERLHIGRLVPPPVSMSWRLVTRPMDLPNRPEGSYLRFSVGGREVPTYSVRRSPTGNWGFVMESCWGLYASFELPPKQSAQQQRQQQRRRLRRTENGARWVDVADEDDTREEDLDPDERQRQIDSDLMCDTALEITNEVQWREAFLYNVGARTLPEGEDATDEFDRAFRGIH